MLFVGNSPFSFCKEKRDHLLLTFCPQNCFNSQIAHLTFVYMKNGRIIGFCGLVFKEKGCFKNV